MMEFILPVLGGFVLSIIIAASVSASISASVREPGETLNEKFVELGTLTGKTYEEIVDACGNPNAISSLPYGKRLCQWQATGYHIALIFDKDDICEGVSSEISV